MIQSTRVKLQSFFRESEQAANYQEWMRTYSAVKNGMIPDVETLLFLEKNFYSADANSFTHADANTIAVEILTEYEGTENASNFKALLKERAQNHLTVQQRAQKDNYSGGGRALLDPLNADAITDDFAFGFMMGYAVGTDPCTAYFVAGGSTDAYIGAEVGNQAASSSNHKHSSSHQHHHNSSSSFFGGSHHKASSPSHNTSSSHEHHSSSSNGGGSDGPSPGSSGGSSD